MQSSASHSQILIGKVCTVLCMVHIRLYTLWLGLYGTLHGTYKIVHSLILIEKVYTVLCMVHIRLYTLSDLNWEGLYGTLHGTYKIVHSLTGSIRYFAWYIWLVLRWVSMFKTLWIESGRIGFIPLNPIGIKMYFILTFKKCFELKREGLLWTKRDGLTSKELV